MRVVLDVNVLVSALISSRGAPGRLLDLWEKERFELVVSPPILEELRRVIAYPRIQERYSLPQEHIDTFFDSVASQAVFVDPPAGLNAIQDDPTDNRYLECAKAGEAIYLVSGDRHLLELGEYEGIEILPPAGFLALLAGTR